METLTIINLSKNPFLMASRQLHFCPTEYFSIYRKKVGEMFIFVLSKIAGLKIYQLMEGSTRKSFIGVNLRKQNFFIEHSS